MLHIVCLIPKFFAPTQPVTPAVKLTTYWGLDRINQPDWPLDNKYPHIGNQGDGITVYVLDTGLNSMDHFLGNRAIVGPAFYEGNVVDLGTKNSDSDGHGTFCAGIIAGKYFGVAPNAKVVGLKVIFHERDAEAFESDIVLALEHVWKKVNVVNDRLFQDRLLYQ